jgi:hypothetical protein
MKRIHAKFELYLRVLESHLAVFPTCGTPIKFALSIRYIPFQLKPDMSTKREDRQVLFFPRASPSQLAKCLLEQEMF